MWWWIATGSGNGVDGRLRPRLREASWVSAAPNVLTKCQRVRGERRSESDGRTAVARQVSGWRRASDSPWQGEDKEVRTALQIEESRNCPVAATRFRKVSWVSAAPNVLTKCQDVRGERRSGSDGRTAAVGNSCAWRRASDSPSPGECRKHEQRGYSKKSNASEHRRASTPRNAVAR